METLYKARVFADEAPPTLKAMARLFERAAKWAAQREGRCVGVALSVCENAVMLAVIFEERPS